MVQCKQELKQRMTTRKIGIMTSGGDCGGLNAAIRAVVLRAVQHYGFEVYGIRYGTLGLMARPVQMDRLLPERFDANLLRQGGTVLGSVNTGSPFAFPLADGTFHNRSQDVIDGFQQTGLDSLICVGGDGSLDIARKLALQGGINIVGIPKTIDNDVPVTESAIGHDTAVQVAVEALDRLQPTAASHNRLMILEVMGRDAGHIALAAGIAGGADIILIPEIPYTLAAIEAKIQQLRANGRNFGLMIVAEAVKALDGQHVTQHGGGEKARYGGIGQHLAEQLTASTGAEIRVTVLGHLQRGGQPSAYDRLLASAFGIHAVDLVAAGKYDRMVAWHNRQVIDISLAEAVASNQIVDVDGALVRTARGLGICLG